MLLPTPTIPIPLNEDGRGGVRVGESLFPLDILIHEYEQGTAPKDIVAAYPVLDLADVYAAIAYYLRHKEAVTAYLKQRAAEAVALRREIEAAQVGQGSLRAKLLARRARQQEQDHAATRD